MSHSTPNGVVVSHTLAVPAMCLICAIAMLKESRDEDECHDPNHGQTQAGPEPIDRLGILGVVAPVGAPFRVE